MMHYTMRGKLTLDVGPHLEEEYGVDDGHHGGREHSDVL
jgi:hypothetical protein